MTIVGDKCVLLRAHNKSKFNLVLDLDSTLICSTLHIKTDQIEYGCDTILCEFDHSSNKIYHVHQRKNLFDFLQEMGKYFNLYIYTMGTFDYAMNICLSIETLLCTEIFSGIVSRYEFNNQVQKYFYVVNELESTNTIIIDDNNNIWINDNKNNVIKINKYKYKKQDDYNNDNDLDILQNILLEYVNLLTKENLLETIEMINALYQSFKA